MPTIREATPGAKWRDELLPANYDGCAFHVESSTIESGRRIALHQFPKKERPFAEDMGHEAWAFNIRGYVIVYPHDDTTARQQNAYTLYQRDYRMARDRLKNRLDDGGPGVLQLPTFSNIATVVVCTRYRLTEEERFGGYAVFDMQFVERGLRPFQEAVDPVGGLFDKTYALRSQVRDVWAQQADEGKATSTTFRRGITINALERLGGGAKTTYKAGKAGPWNPLVRFIGPPNKMRRFNPLQRSGKKVIIATGPTSPPMTVQGKPGGHDQF